MGISKEDRVALLLPNGPEAALSFLATSTISVCAPLNPVCTVNELDAALSHIKPKVLIASPDLDPEKRAVAAKHGISVITATPDLKREAGVFTGGRGRLPEYSGRGRQIRPRSWTRSYRQCGRF